MTGSGPAVLAQTGPGGASELFADASVYLITGGLVILGVIVLLVLLRSLFPASRSSTAALDRGREIVLKPTPNVEADAARGEPGPFDSDDVEQGRKAASSDKPPSIRELARALERRGAGDPRILSVGVDRVRFRMYGCDECRDSKGRSAGCGRQAGYLRQAAETIWKRGAKVRETACRRHDSPVCEFEVVAQ